MWSITCLLCAVMSSFGVATSTLLYVGSSAGDLFSLLAQTKQSLRRFDMLDDALDAAVVGDSLLVTNDAGPVHALNISQAQYSRIAGSGLQGAYLEQPMQLPNDAALYAPSPAWYYDRLVWLSDTNSTPGLPSLSILQAQGAYFLDYPSPAWLNTSLLAYAHVAGSTRAIYGLPAPATLNPVLFTVPAYSGSTLMPIWVGAIKLSCVVQCRYAPQVRWQALWDIILGQILGNEAWGSLPSWMPLVGPTLPSPPSASNPAPSLLSSFKGATGWLAHTSGLLHVNDTTLCPAPYAPEGATIVCMLEGYGSQMNVSGGQAPATDARMDCNGESAMALALRAWTEQATAPTTAQQYAANAAGLLDYVWLHSIAAQGPRANASDPSYGVLAWGVNPEPWSVCSYADDNARVITASMLALPVLAGQGYDTTTWARLIMRSALANLRLSAVSGFRPGRLNYADLEAHGWEYYANATWGYDGGLQPQPHYQAQMWTVFVWAYAVTGYAPFLARATAGVDATMQVYLQNRQGFYWTEYLTEEQARLMQTLAWLVRVTGNSTHLTWLRQLGRDYLTTQDPVTGAVRETLGAPGLCNACPCPSNEAYGTGEASLLGQSGDTITDQLYTTNYALPALWEAYFATGDMNAFGRPAMALAGYLASIQLTTNATQLAYLNGSWMRGMDYVYWEPWGAAGDSGWGPWSIETGWSATWVAAGMAAISINTSLWDIATGKAGAGTGSVDWATAFAAECPSFFPSSECSTTTPLAMRSVDRWQTARIMSLQQ